MGKISKQEQQVSNGGNKIMVYATKGKPGLRNVQITYNGKIDAKKRSAKPQKTGRAPQKQYKLVVGLGFQSSLRRNKSCLHSEKSRLTDDFALGELCLLSVCNKPA